MKNELTYNDFIHQKKIVPIYIIRVLLLCLTRTFHACTNIKIRALITIFSRAISWDKVIWNHLHRWKWNVNIYVSKTYILHVKRILDTWWHGVYSYTRSKIQNWTLYSTLIPFISTVNQFILLQTDG